jgi:hypothetical protein
MLARSAPRASPAGTAPRRSPPVRALIMAREETPGRSDATGPGLMPASCSVFGSRWISLAREPASPARYPVRSRSPASFRAGTQQPRTSPHPGSSASQQQPAAPVLRPGTGFLACAGSHLITSRPPHSARARTTGSGQIPAASIATRVTPHPVSQAHISSRTR